MSIKNTIKQATSGSPLFAPLRGAYQLAFNRSQSLYRRRLKAFFAQFISPTDLVFDIGANIGEYTEVFASLGAQVVAVEPNPELAQTLRRIRPFKRIALEAAAVGPAVGEAELHLCGKDCLATLSSEWISVAEKSARFSGLKWNEKIRVPVLTLDTLIQKYGKPQFIKIDVEGFENDVLSGLSNAPGIVYFEFNSEFASAAVDCVEQRCFPEESEFNISLGISMTLLHDRWVRRDEIVRFLKSPAIVNSQTYGDIVVRRQGAM